jgi:hypothetical protein
MKIPGEFEQVRRQTEARRAFAVSDCRNSYVSFGRTYRYDQGVERHESQHRCRSRCKPRIGITLEEFRHLVARQRLVSSAGSVEDESSKTDFRACECLSVDRHRTTLQSLRSASLLTTTAQAWSQGCIPRKISAASKKKGRSVISRADASLVWPVEYMYVSRRRPG